MSIMSKNEGFLMVFAKEGISYTLNDDSKEKAVCSFGFAGV